MYYNKVMKFIILCGGIGKRCNNYSLPKPLNYINGKYMIEYIIENIPSNEIYIVYNICLEEYNFEEIIINIFKTKKIFFSKVEYLTRGAVESAYVGINQFNLTNADQLVFIDNDNIHTFPNFNKMEDNNFIGYGKNYEKTNYSFITIHNNMISNIEEKQKISDDYCCGIYGFKNLLIFNTYAKRLIEQNFKTKNEFYFSQMYKLMLLNKEIIIPIHIEETSHIGSYDEIMLNFTVTPTFADKKLRICFDLDNTLVTYPTIPNDYSTVKPIPKMIHLLNSLKRKGHEIIIYTARRMKTHQNNVGKVIKDIALTTINTLTDLNIPYDELIFGKPIADVYIDDRAINPYINDISYFGIFNEKTDFIHNKVANNKYNSLKKINNIIKKHGPYQFLRGELFFYQNIPVSISNLFAKLISFNKLEDNLEISLDHIEGIPLYFLYKNKFITTTHIDSLFAVLKVFHTYDYPITIDDIHVNNNYFNKLQTRFNTNDYFFADAQEVYDKIMGDLTKYYSPTIVGIIHGDFWFSNIIMEYNDNYKCIDMKGQVDNILTLNGDMYYDYGKLYQSILGYDLILNNCQPDIDYINSIKAHFLNKCRENKLNIDYLTAVTKSLIFGTFHFIEGNEIKQRVWDFLKKI
jgi:capsule biosynthesis phosphatase